MRGVQCRVNGAAVVAEQSVPTTNTSQGLTVFAPISLAANDYVELFAFQNSGGNLNVTPALWVAFRSG